MINVAIMGFGNIGSGTWDVIEGNGERLLERLGDKVNVKTILDVRTFPDHPASDRMESDFRVIEEDPEIDIVVETMGGTTPAYDFVKRCLLAGKHVVTSNKALVAAHGTELIAIAKEKSRSFLFEASVGGGIPIIRTISNAFSTEAISGISGILNGTTNFILTKMDEEGASFASALAEAQRLGYAEQNPEADVEGHDTCRKTAILASLMCKKEVNYEEIYTEGITAVEDLDFSYAKQMKASIKLLGSARLEDGRLFAYVCPILISSEHILYSVKGVYNGVLVESNMLGKSMLFGSGAGKLPTAGAVVADIQDIAADLTANRPLGWGKETMPVEEMEKSSHRYFVRFGGSDQEYIDHCLRVFGKSVLYRVEGADEFGILTGFMREKDFLAVLEGMKDCIKFLRADL